MKKGRNYRALFIPNYPNMPPIYGSAKKTHTNLSIQNLKTNNNAPWYVTKSHTDLQQSIVASQSYNKTCYYSDLFCDFSRFSWILIPWKEGWKFSLGFLYAGRFYNRCLFVEVVVRDLSLWGFIWIILLSVKTFL